MSNRNLLWLGMVCLFFGGMLIGVSAFQFVNRSQPVMWGDDFLKPTPPSVTTASGHTFTYAHYRFICLTAPDNRQFEIGMRKDGVVVWREVKP